jgi:membrane protein
MNTQKPSTLRLAVTLTQLAAGVYLMWKERHLSKSAIRIPRPQLAEEVPFVAAPRGAESLPVDQPKEAVVKPEISGPLWKRLWQVAVGAAKEWSAHRAASKGAALALYMLFSLAPMLVLLVTVVGFFLGEDAVRAGLVAQMSGLMGSQAADAIKTLLGDGQNQRSGVVAGAVSIVLVLISATSAFAELKNSLDELWEVPASTKSGLWNLIHERFLSFGLILVLALMMLASLAVSAGLAAVGNLWSGGNDSPFHWFLLALSDIFAFAVVTGLFAVIFKYLPAVKLGWKDVGVGAMLTAALFTIGKFVIGLYVAHADISSAYGAAGSIVILVTWIYYSAQIFFYGALFTHEYASKMGSHAGQVDDAQKPAKSGDAKNHDHVS